MNKKQLLVIANDLDKGLTGIINKFQQSVLVSLDRHDARITKCEIKIQEIVRETIISKNNELNFAALLVKKELRGKILLSQWINTFLACTENEVHLDPITFAYVRFSLSICLSFRDVSIDYLLESQVHKQLISYLNNPLDVVCGPSIMALVHLSLSNAMKDAIVEANALPVILNLSLKTKSIVILAQISKLVASLALFMPNKKTIVQSGCFHMVIDLFAGNLPKIEGNMWSRAQLNLLSKSISLNEFETNTNSFRDRHLLYYALCAATNLIYLNDSNRTLAIELKAVNPVIHILRSSPDIYIIEVCAKLLANICFNNTFTTQTILSLNGDVVLFNALESFDLLKDVSVIQAILSCFSCMCSSESSQSHFGGIEKLMSYSIRCLNLSSSIQLVTAAAKFLLALVWRHDSNKFEIGCSYGGISALLKRLIRHFNDFYENEKADSILLLCLEYLCASLSSLLLNISTQSIFVDIGGVIECTRIGKVCSNKRILGGIAMILVAMVPSPEKIYLLHSESTVSEVERVGSLAVLKKIRISSFGDIVEGPPIWLEKAVSFLFMQDEALKSQSPWIKEEFVDNMVFFEEFFIDIQADQDILTDNILQQGNFIFSLY